MKRQTQLSRRRFLSIIASTACLTVSPARCFAIEPRNTPVFNWSGEVLGGFAQMQFLGKTETEAKALSELSLIEIDRLEKIFSLYRPGSEIRRLNETGKIIQPSSELVKLLRESRKLSILTKGIFDVSMQPLWHYLFYLHGAQPENSEIVKLKSLVDYRKINIADEEISFQAKGMQISLNGIAQGYVTDSVTKLLRENGLKNALVQLGENFALGRNKTNSPWSIGIENPTNTDFIKTVSLQNQAIATSGAYGTRFDTSKQHHLLNPKKAKSPEFYESLSVIADTATEADGLSTALSLVESKEHQGIISQYPNAYTVVLNKES